MRGRVVVVGGGGYFGRALVSALLRDGLTVTSIGRKRPEGQDGALTLACDAASPAALRQAARDADVVVNAADGAPDMMVAIAGQISALLRADEIGRVVQISSLAVYGQQEGVLDEDTMPAPARGHRYARAKCQAELALTVDDLAQRSLILRPGCLYGPGAPVWVDRVARMLWARRLGWLGTEGEGACNLLHVADMARAAVAAIKGQLSGTVNVLSPEYMSWNSYFLRLGAALDILPVRHVGRVSLALDGSAANLARAIVSGPAQARADALTPTMRRLFRGGASIVSARPPLLPSTDFTRHRDGIADAAAEWRARATRRPDTASRVTLWGWRSAPAA